MNPVIQWLQALGEMAHTDPQDIRQLANEYQIREELVEALLKGDHHPLTQALGARENVVAFLVPSREDEEEEDKPIPSDPSDPSSPEEDQPETRQSKGRIASAGA